MSATPAKSVVFLHKAPAPYRVDFFNALARVLDITVLFMRKNASEHPYWNHAAFQREMKYEFLSESDQSSWRQVITLCLARLEAQRPSVIVASEFGVGTLVAFFYRARHPECGVVIMTDLHERGVQRVGMTPRMVRRLLATKADAVITCSTAGSAYVRSLGVDENAIHRTLILRDETLYRRELTALTQSSRDLRDELSIQHRPVVFFAGRLEKEKGVDRIITAFARARQQTNSNPVLVIVGEGSELKHLQEIVMEQGVAPHVLFRGFVPPEKLPAYFLLAQAFLFLSEMDLFGAVVNEALMAGVPVICSSSAGARDCIRQGENGFVVDPFDIEEASRCLGILLAREAGNNEALRPSLMRDRFEDQVEQALSAISQAGVRIHGREK